MGLPLHDRPDKDNDEDDDDEQHNQTHEGA